MTNLYDIESLFELYGEEYVLKIMLYTFIAIGIFYLGIYVLKAVATCRMAKKRGFKNWWLGMIPYANYYVLGKLAGPVRIFRVDVKNIGVIVLIGSIILDAMNLVNVLSIFGASFILTFTHIINVISYFAYFVELAFYISYFVLVSAIFGKYAPERRLIYTILSFIQILFPIFLITIMNNKPYNSLDEYYREKMANRYGQTYNPYTNPFQTRENPYNSGNEKKQNEVFEDPFDEFKGE